MQYCLVFRLSRYSRCTAVAAFLLTFGIGMYPNLMRSLPTAANSLTIYNSASGEKTLGIVLIIAGLGIPIVLAYTISIYWIFRGKVRIDKRSY